jgi:hypothetical protein
VTQETVGPASGFAYPPRFGENPHNGNRGTVQVAQAEDERTVFATRELEALGARVRDAGGRLRIQLKDGRRFDFYPWKGWFQGVGNPGSGRGIHKLLELARGGR